MQYNTLLCIKTKESLFLSIRIPKYVNAITEPPNSYKIHTTFKCSQIVKGGRLPPSSIVDMVFQLRSHQHFAGRPVAYFHHIYSSRSDGNLNRCLLTAVC